MSVLTEWETLMIFLCNVQFYWNKSWHVVHHHTSSFLPCFLFMDRNIVGVIVQFKRFSFNRQLKRLKSVINLRLLRSRKIHASFRCSLFYHMLLTEVLLTGHFSLSEPVLMLISNIDTAVSRERLKALLLKKKKMKWILWIIEPVR